MTLVLAVSLGLAGCASLQSPPGSGRLDPSREHQVAKRIGPPPPFQLERPYLRFCYWC
ncbi:MAG: hypothetical protein HY726_20935 [Candidatus Rokubacteria bacterium]|nr:hypothetical protein [Candidatus Rokubacteria bacterium]